MEIIKSFENLSPISASVISVGNYDGIHLGHKDVINHIVKYARKHSIPSCVITFDPNPYYVLGNGDSPINIQSIDSKIELLEKMGIDKVLVIPFTKQFSRMSATDFANQIIKKIFNPKKSGLKQFHSYGQYAQNNTSSRYLGSWTIVID